jgi:hypothetical protein
MDGTNMPISSLLEQAAYVVRRKKETTGTLGETESHKRGQIEALISFANENQLWFSCMDYADEFHNDEYEIFDAVPNNVLYGIDGDLYFIDTQIRLKEDFEWL